MFRTDLLSIISSLYTVFTATVACHISHVDCLLATSTHTPQDRHLITPRTPYAAKEIVTSIAPEGGRISPKHFELKELK